MVMGDSVFLHLAGGLGVKFGERDGSSEIEKRKAVFGVCMFASLHDMHLHVLDRRTNYCLIVLFLHSPLPLPPPTHPHTPSSPPSFGQLETEFIRFVLLLFSLPTAPFPPPFPSPPHCRNRICRNHSKARYNLLLAVHNTPSHSHPLSQSHKVPCG